MRFSKKDSVKYIIRLDRGSETKFARYHGEYRILHTGPLEREQATVFGGPAARWAYRLIKDDPKYAQDGWEVHAEKISE
jgi:hypothetical protein